jgi:hypothetical protein
VFDLLNFGTFRLAAASQGLLGCFRDMLIQNMNIRNILDFGVTIRVARDIPSSGNSSWSANESRDEHTRAKRLKDFPSPMSLRVSVGIFTNV